MDRVGIGHKSPGKLSLTLLAPNELALYGVQVTNSRLRSLLTSKEGVLACAAFIAILLNLFGRLPDLPAWAINLPLWLVIGVGGVFLLVGIAKSLIQKDPGADLLAAIAIVAAAIMQQWLVSAIIVLMLSGGEALEGAVTARASAVLDALARRAPTIAHRLVQGADQPEDIEVDQIAVGDTLLILPHELVPVDGEVVEGHGQMQESYLTGEPYFLAKSPGSPVISGAANGEVALRIKATRLAKDSRYAQIVGVLHNAETTRPRVRRLADRLGTIYTPIALAFGIAGWAITGDPHRFLDVVVIATPCPLLIGVPVAIIGAISLSAKAGVIIRDPSILETLPTAKTILFDKTGTLTYGRPELVAVDAGPGLAIAQTLVSGPGDGAELDGDDSEAILLALAAGLEAYSNHPLAGSLVLAGAAQGQGRKLVCQPEVVADKAGVGLIGQLAGHEVMVTSRERAAASMSASDAAAMPAVKGGMEAVMLIDGLHAATFRFRDIPRLGARSFVEHLAARHSVRETVMISGDAEGEVQWVAKDLGIDTVYARCTPEQKLAIVREATAKGVTVFMGDGINDAPAMTAATVGIAFGQESDVTSEAAGAVVLDSALDGVDELFHVSKRMRRIALQSVLGGMALSVIGMGFAVVGLLPALFGAIAQEVIDLLAVLNAARVPLAKLPMSDYHGYRKPGQAPELPELLAAEERAEALVVAAHD
ncbi:MAG: heavy metal translocating P-type ATPase [Micrococcales bacterium]|nr:heavy metal translocating P-type ATPase [Micrococcales bacterium]